MRRSHHSREGTTMKRTLFRSASATLVVAALLTPSGALGPGLAADAATADPAPPGPGRSTTGPPRDKVAKRSSVEFGVALRYTPATRDVTVVSKAARLKRTGQPVRGIPVSTTTFGPSQRPAERTSYTCLVKSDPHGRLRAGEPTRVNLDGRSFSMKYLVFPYTLNKARRLSGVFKKQLEFCITGGGDVWNGFHQVLNGASVAFAMKSDRTIGTKWGTKVANGAVQSTISLKVGAGPISVGASTTVADKDKHTGSTGKSGDVGSWDAIEPYNANRLNVFYKSGRTWRWQGTDDYQGNNGHLLVELNQRSGRHFGFFVAGALRAMCSHPFGFGCGDLQ